MNHYKRQDFGQLLRTSVQTWLFRLKTLYHMRTRPQVIPLEHANRNGCIRIPASHQSTIFTILKLYLHETEVHVSLRELGEKQPYMYCTSEYQTVYLEEDITFLLCKQINHVYCHHNEVGLCRSSVQWIIKCFVESLLILIVPRVFEQDDEINISEICQ